MINSIIFGVLVFMLVVCIISAVTEIIPSKSKKTFNFFRFIRVKMREISLTSVIFFSAIIIIINAFENSPENIIYAEILLLFLCWLTIHGERIFRTLRSRKIDSPKQYRPVIKENCKLLGKLPLSALTAKLPLKSELKPKNLSE